MEDNLKYFEKYIIKQVVNMVGYSPERDEYDFNHIHLTDDIMQEIEAEGRRYGIQDTELQQVITQTIDHIRVEPSVNVKYGNITLDSLKVGQHLRLKIAHPDKGEHSIDMLFLQPEQFFVLTSDIPGLVYEDVLISIDKVWNTSYDIEFKVMRGGELVPNSATILHLGKLESVEFFTPSIVHEIMDADNTFTFDEVETKDILYDSTNTKKYYLWMPTGWSPILFKWQEGDLQDVNSPFIIFDNPEDTEANLMVNPKFSITEISEGVDQLVSIISDCCVCRNEQPPLRKMKGIKTVKLGILKRNDDQLYTKEWVVVVKPQIKYIYDE